MKHDRHPGADTTRFAESRRKKTCHFDAQELRTLRKIVFPNAA